MNVQVSGKHVDVGEALRTKVGDELSGSIGRYFDRGGDAHAAFGHALIKIEARVRRYKQRLKSHTQAATARAAETAAFYILRAPSDAEDEEEWDGAGGDSPPAAMIIAETETALKTMTVSMAVM